MYSRIDWIYLFGRIIFAMTIPFTLPVHTCDTHVHLYVCTELNQVHWCQPKCTKTHATVLRNNVRRHQLHFIFLDLCSGVSGKPRLPVFSTCSSGALSCSTDTPCHLSHESSESILTHPTTPLAVSLLITVGGNVVAFSD